MYDFEQYYRISGIRALALVWLGLSSGCVDAGLDTCPDGLGCPLGTKCLYGYNLCIPEVCGDGIVDNARGDVCDFGGINTDTCDADCTLPECGDGFVNPAAGEECDDRGHSWTCDGDCTFAVCGDGVTNALAGEECDDGNQNDSDACVAGCQLARCGDGFVQAGLEVCDSGGQDSAACDRDCSRPQCGDGLVNVNAGEQCDDAGESVRCDRDCTVPVCGDGVLNRSAGEVCDDSNLRNDDACLDNCQEAWCGDGFIHTGTEECDDGNVDDSDDCTSGCLPASCSDRISNADEYDIDCGGHCGPGSCTLTQACVGDDDCASGNCRDGRCTISHRLSAGDGHTCVVDNGTVRCWGEASSGQLGYADTVDIGDDELPVSAGEVFVGQPVAQIAAGDSHTCALLHSGDVRCWGLGTHGRLGYGNTENIGDDETPNSAGSVDVGGVVRQIAAGGEHTCALLVGGSVRCWGRGRSGRLGYRNTESIGDDENPSTAGDVQLGGTAIELAAGSYHTCALLDTGHVRCWGDAGYGQLGYGYGQDVGDDEHPLVAGNVDVGGQVRQIVASRNQTCALLETGGVRCWGANDQGQLGYGHTARLGDNETPNSAGDVPLGDLAIQIATGQRHTCALLNSGHVKCWGWGWNGRLGYGNTETIGDDELPSSVALVDVGGPVVELSLGGDHTCARMTTGGIRCWGHARQGQLGLGHKYSIGDDEPPSWALEVMYQ